MAESIVGWFVVREKYCSFAKKLQLIRQANMATCWHLIKNIGMVTWIVFWSYPTFMICFRVTRMSKDAMASYILEHEIRY
jgi:hypothetical protein